MERKNFRTASMYFLSGLLVLVGCGMPNDQLTNETNTNAVHAEQNPRAEPSKLWERGEKSPLAQNADYTSAKSLAVSLSYPIYGDGSKSHPASFTGGGRIDAELASNVYKDVKTRARAVAKDFNNRYPPSDIANYADCGAFVASIIINLIDPDFPGLLVDRQREYVEQPQNGWGKVADGENYEESELQTGDLFISKNSAEPDHVWMWLGEVNGHQNVIADASFGREGSPSAYLPSLRINPLQSAPQDSRGRSYEIWRYGNGQGSQS